ncbi:MAG: hypothetical protein QXS54_11230 [Candidatus Methanomethylicaceae archaeon]
MKIVLVLSFRVDKFTSSSQPLSQNALADNQVFVVLSWPNSSFSRISLSFQQFSIQVTSSLKGSTVGRTHAATLSNSARLPITRKNLLFANNLRHTNLLYS